MKTYLLFLVSLCLLFSCKDSDTKIEVPPDRFRIELGGAHDNHPILNPYSSRPSVWLSCIADSCLVEVGYEDPIAISISPDSIRRLEHLVEGLLPIPETYFVENVFNSSFLTIIRDINGRADTIYISDYQRMDIPIEYREAPDSVNTAALDISRIVEHIVRYVLDKSVSPGRLIYATSMKEALEIPLRIEKLRLRNLRRPRLDSNISKLKILKY